MRQLLSGIYTQIPVLTMNKISDFDRMLVDNQIETPPTENTAENTAENIVEQPAPTFKTITFDMSTDYYYYESSWNVWSEADRKFLYNRHNIFSDEYERIVTKLSLATGKYKLCLYDSYGDGGIRAVVSDGTTQLVNIQMIRYNNEILFEVTNK